MSNIPRARLLLEQALESDEVWSGYHLIEEALSLMTRKSPAFVAKRTIPPLTVEQKAAARQMRDAGLPMNSIAVSLGTNLGRISEAVNEDA